MRDRPEDEIKVTTDMMEAVADILMDSGLEDGLVSRLYALKLAEQVSAAVLRLAPLALPR